MGRISVPWLRQSARPRRARRATLTSITGYLLCGPGPGVLEHRWGNFTFGAPTCGARHGGEKAPAQRERKGSERRKDFAKQNPEGGQAKPGRAFGASLARRTAGATLSAPLRTSLSLDSESRKPDYRDVKCLYRSGILEGG
jgi:hypothetical protein